jgi:hypothetical protein
VKALAAVVALAVLGLQLAAPGVPAQDDGPPSCPTNAFRDFARHAGPHADVWYEPGTGHRGRAAATRVASQVNGRIWPAFAKLLGRTPPPDDGQECFHGPDGKLDVYLTTSRKIGGLKIPRRIVALTHPFVDEPCAPQQPDFVVVRPAAPRWVIAHELFHAFQSAYGRAQPCIFYSEWEEATATWAGDFVYPRDNIEHNHPEGIERPEVHLDLWGYGTWVFPYYLTKKYKDPKIIRRIEEAGESFPADAHVDHAIPGGFRERFPEFALYAWNRAPIPRTDKIKRSFRQWDGIANVPHPRKSPVNNRKLRLGGATRRTEPWPARLQALGRDYRHYTVVDKKLRYIAFENPAPTPDFGVTAFVRLAGKGWRVQTWTGRSEVPFCRDLPNQDVREVVIALSNAGYTEPFHAEPKLKLEAHCPLYLGEVTGTSQWDQGPCPDVTHESLGYSAKLEKSTHTGGPEQPFALVDDQTLANPGVGLAAWGNGETGNGSWSRDACDTDPGCTSALLPDVAQGHGHVIFSVEGANVKATARTWSWKSVDQGDCFLESGVPVFGVGTFPLSQVGDDTITVPLSLVTHSNEDGFTSDFVGSGTLTLHRAH